ncbi:hypothetical protein ABB37_05353 [Leptomonas pyrrhocoris]|uniref:Uncharacterized protein n=1 Tax=Leptomonas pyrrhocoris TaxID=157538 RepID=A0A0M9G052_LEPPY|nr:hypothetical protein ABB37_05353 [Leptomonas pyrrhocoris]KPA79533.1 hypothetical protein ABB37_05353 [Leptomonas pyrrhocoris]|eukprot:XP_015657972.1 hypothetical protein ABB37_05353 [Leptomonas pyrrhocoris]
MVASGAATSIDGVASATNALPSLASAPTLKSAEAEAAVGKGDGEEHEGRGTEGGKGEASSAHDKASSSSSSTVATSTRSKGGKKKPQKKKKASPPSASVVLVQATEEPQDDPAPTPVMPSTDEGDEKKEAAKEEMHSEMQEPALPTAADTSTRRATPPPPPPPNTQEEGTKDDDEPEAGKEIRCSDTEDSTEPSPFAASSTPHTDASLSFRSSATWPSSPASFTSPVRSKHDEVLEAATQAAIQAQERQLRHTLLSIFPAHLRAMNSENTQPTRDDARLHSTASTSLLMCCSPEPLLPLLNALCEDKAYVHAAWCRYEDDLAVQRAQNSIQRKRQRHSFNKGARRPASSVVTTTTSTPATTAAAAAAASSEHTAGGDRGAKEASDSDSHADDDASQPPESEWVEAAPAFTGPPRLPSATRIDNADAREEMAVASGFQWTPWRFFREKRRRSSSRSQGSSGAVTATAAVSFLTSKTGPTATSAAVSGSSTSTAGATTAVSSTVATSGVPPAPTPVGGGGVPPLLFSEVPSLPVLQVDADIPEDVTATVEAMTAEEQRSCARYVMSSGKLRNVCRDPYAFLVSRAKEMRIQWERQHPFE